MRSSKRISIEVQGTTIGVWKRINYPDSRIMATKRHKGHKYFWAGWLVPGIMATEGTRDTNNLRNVGTVYRTTRSGSNGHKRHKGHIKYER
ncbi:MAG: hypothetical protein A3J97_09860 [Spirochaetes bacterium RIFOXYC1_FULL_54_7]|nr:MAG: hypothetical protein A3J97_09860 [Spirochaetes bacterium RIFOXYC1_FULL_54_7]